ncbi:MAG: leucine-rich repeat protein [Roseburia sp.]|nr:leucine-rich repeat protein [Roseburia sp.]MCM1280057.1 leucine-rich repeat protein [Robinsoniella sp.]
MRKKMLLIFAVLTMFWFMIPVSASAANTDREPTRTELLQLSDFTSTTENLEEGWKWEPDKDGGTLTLTNCYIQSSTQACVLDCSLFLGLITQGTSEVENRQNRENIHIVLNGDNIFETTSTYYNSMFMGAKNYTISGSGSLQIRTASPITSSAAPYGFPGDSLTIDSGNILTNVQLCVIKNNFTMNGGSLAIDTPSSITNIDGIYTLNGAINISGGVIRIATGECAIHTDNGSINITGGSIRANSSLANLYANPRGDESYINITGGSFIGRGAQAGIYANSINIGSPDSSDDSLFVDVEGSTYTIGSLQTPLAVSNAIVMAADEIYNYSNATLDDCIIFIGNAGQVYGDAIITGNPDIPDDASLNIPEDTTLTIANGATLNLAQGTITNNGSLTNHGSLILPEDSDVVWDGTGTVQKGNLIYNSSNVQVYPVTIKQSEKSITEHYEEGATVTLHPDIPNGYYMKEWSVIPDTIIISSNHQFVMPASSVTIEAVFEAQKAVPENVPVDMEVDNTIKSISSISLSDGWVWADEDSQKSIPAGGTVTAQANYTAEDAAHYATTSVSVKVTRAACEEDKTILFTGEDEHAPTCTLDGVGHTECSLCEDSISTNVKVPATGHVWNEGIVTKEPTAFQTGERTFTCNVCETTRVEEIEMLIEKPAGAPVDMEVDNTIKTVSSIPLSDGWVWAEEDSQKSIPAGGTVTAQANYTVEDTAHYATTSVSVKITRAACKEDKTILFTGEGEHAPTCTLEGVGHTKCSLCGDTITTNVKVPATGHVWDKGIITKEATATQKGLKTYTCTVCGTKRTEDISASGAPKKGTRLTDKKTKNIYKVTASGSTVEYVKAGNTKAASITIPKTVTIDGITYKVTGIAKNAFKNNRKLKKLIIESNIKTIGQNAFYGCKQLKNITIKTKKLTTKSVGSKAFKGIHSKAVIKVPKAKLKTYKKLLKSRGIGSKVTVKK